MKLQDALTKDEEREMFSALQACEPGSDEHKRIVSVITERNLKLVVMTARRHLAKFPEFYHTEEDVTAYYFAKLPVIVRAFNPSLGYAFSTYVSGSIEREIRRTVREIAFTVRIPYAVRDCPKFSAITFDLIDDTEASPDEREGTTAWCQNRVADLLGALPEPEREVLQCRFGIGRVAMSAKAIAEARGVTTQHIGIIHSRAIRRIRTAARMELAS